MRRSRKLSRKDYKVYGPEDGQLNKEVWRIHDGVQPLNEFLWSREDFVDGGYIPVLDFKYVQYKEYFNQGFKPFKKR